MTDIIKDKKEEAIKDIKVKDKVKDNKEGNVTMTKEQYDSLMFQMTELKKKVDYVSDKDRLERFEAQKSAGKNILPTVKIPSLDGKIVVGWRTVSNECEFRNGVYYEKQITELTFEDQTSQKMDLVEFYRHKKGIVAEVIKRSFDAVLDIDTLTVRFPDGKELIIGLTYVN